MVTDEAIMASNEVITSGNQGEMVELTEHNIATWCKVDWCEGWIHNSQTEIMALVPRHEGTELME